MRFRNDEGIYRIYAVTGTNTIAFAIDCDESAMENLLGFMIEKEYDGSDGGHVRVTVMGFKVFKERIENPVPGSLYSTYDNPIQSFTWEDFTAYPGWKYTYRFTPLFDDPKNIRRGDTVSLDVETEPAWKENDHSIFFNRGVASSQAYAKKFGNKNPDTFKDGSAYKWLSRGLKEAIVSFIQRAQIDDGLYCSFYEFHNEEMLEEFYKAAEKGVKLFIIYDAKENEDTDKETGKLIESYPKVINEKAIKKAGLDAHQNVELTARRENKSYISHNKFMILVRNNEPLTVLTGSTNISKGGIYGQTNVAHVIDDKITAGKYFEYWKVLKTDPASKKIKDENHLLQEDFENVDDIPDGVTCIFSPRKDIDMLKFYAKLMDSSTDCACITLAFGVHKLFEEALGDNNTNSYMTYLLLEKDDPDISDYIYKNNVIKAVGSYISNDSVYKWLAEKNTAAWKLNKHVKYVHTKFLLKDPLSKTPVVATGSYNFSDAATLRNDENMIIIKGNVRIADIYFTEFMRIFNHYYFRWIINKMQEKGIKDDYNPAFLKSDYREWTEQYKPGKYKRKKVEMFVKMFKP